jgi:hypothetical protein
VSERNFSFITAPDKYELRTLSGKKVLEGIRVKKLYQLLFTAIPNLDYLASANLATTVSSPTSDLALISISHCTDPLI